MFHCCNVVGVRAVEATELLWAFLTRWDPLSTHWPVAVDALRGKVLAVHCISKAFGVTAVTVSALAPTVAPFLPALVAEMRTAKADHCIASFRPTNPKRTLRTLLSKLPECCKQLWIFGNLRCTCSKVTVQQDMQLLDVSRCNPCNVVREQSAGAVAGWASDVWIAVSNNARPNPSD